MSATQIINVTVKGAAPLLQHRFATEKQTEAPVRASGKRNYDSEALDALYTLRDGTIYQPATHFEQAIKKSAAKFLIGGRGKKSYKELVQCALLVKPDCIVHKIQKYNVDRRAVIVNKSRIMRERPIFPEWELEFEIHLLDVQLKIEAVNTILVDAGQYVGIGDYRPKYGRFIVTRFEAKE